MTHLSDAILNAEEFTEPWHYIVIHDALAPADYDLLLDEMNRRPTKVTAGRLTRDLPPENYFAKLINADDVKDALDEMCDFAGPCWPRLLCDVEGFQMKMHSDEEKRALRAGIFQLYITHESVAEHGTFLHDEAGASVAEIQFAPNTAYAFKRTAQTLHSCGPMVEDRWSLLAPHMEY